MSYGTPYSERSIIMSDDVQTLSIILRELSMDQTDRKDEWTLWPHASELGIYPDSTAFLRCLQRDPPIETVFPGVFDDTCAYPGSAASERYFFKENGESRWTILTDPSGDTPDFVPIILSSGIDVAALCDLLAGRPPADRKARLMKKGSRWGILHFKDWKVIFLNNRSFDARERARTMARFGVIHSPYTVTYLTPTGMVTVTFRSQ